MSLESLMDIEVTSVSKRAEHISEAPAAIYVITQEDFRRSGATSIPEALRMVPGLHVAQMDSNKWAITSRGTAIRRRSARSWPNGCATTDGLCGRHPISGGA